MLETVSGWTSQYTEKIRPNEGHSRPGDGIGRDKSGHRKKSGRDHNIRHKEETYRKLVVTFQ